MIAINHRAAVLVLGGLLAWSQREVATAQVIVTPSITVREEYDDNITFSSRAPRSDFVTAVIPGLQLEVRGYPWNIVVGGSVRGEAFANHSELDNFGDTASANGSVDFYPTRTLRLSVTETFFRTVNQLESAPDRRGLPPETAVRLTGRSLSTDNTVGAAVRYDADPLTLLELRYSFNTFRSESELARDSDTQRGDLLVQRQITPLDTGSIRYTFSHFEVEGEPARNAHFPRLGLSHAFSPSIRLSGEVGPLILETSKGTEITAGGGLKYDQQFRRGTLSVAYDRSAELAGRIGQEPGVSQGLSLVTTFAATRTATVNFTSSARETEGTKPDLRSIVAGIGVSYDPLRSISIRLSSTLGDYRSSDSTVSFLAYTVDAQVSYRIYRWLSVEGGYRFQRQDDRVGQNDLQRNVVFFGITASDRFRID